jgi:hypothetical protein
MRCRRRHPGLEDRSLLWGTGKDPGRKGASASAAAWVMNQGAPDSTEVSDHAPFPSGGGCCYLYQA